MRAIEARNTHITFSELYALLLKEESQLKFDSLTLNFVVLATAHYANSRRGSRGHGRGYRGRGGQSSYQGRSFGQSSYASGRGTSTLTCFNFNGTGHVSRQCPSPRTNSQANVVKTQTKPLQVWTVDSGANYHLVANQETIAHPVPVNDPTALTIANGKTLSCLISWFFNYFY
ncbi:uncharacterized protein LOC110600535 [Manihot esculenta]|uniref:uncharacterized protein LOC110600535 n=1 Tax=Manihot esculenta TaxID=3983 RepID=UPI000B5D5D5D|nr:uncharacterized protein LOC110600535 [Manihot esculenta]